MHIRRIHLLAIPAVLMALLLAGEILYRRHARREFERVFHQVRRAHSDERVHVTGTRRFGEDVSDLRLSLARDLWEGLLKRSHSRLARHGGLNGGASYAAFRVGTQEQESGRCWIWEHEFIWSPRTLGFHRVDWAYQGKCHRPDCPAYSGEPPCTR